MSPDPKVNDATFVEFECVQKSYVGDIRVGGELINNIPPHKRRIGMVFQNYALFPHMTVAENLAFPMEVRKIGKSEREERVQRVLDMVQMGKFGGRRPAQLSGGQQQRIALARIIAFAKIVFALMIVIAPLMILCSLFRPTHSLFEAWVRSTIGYALMPVAAAGAAGIIVAIAEAIGDASASPDAVATVSLILPFLVILILSAGIMASVPYIASNLTGVMGIASNAVGLTGLARHGIANTASFGTGAATRLTTGQTPYELRRGVSDGLTSAGTALRQSPGAALTTLKSFRKT